MLNNWPRILTCIIVAAIYVGIVTFAILCWHWGSVNQDAVNSWRFLFALSIAAAVGFACTADSWLVRSDSKPASEILEVSRTFITNTERIYWTRAIHLFVKNLLLFGWLHT